MIIESFFISLVFVKREEKVGYWNQTVILEEVFIRLICFCEAVKWTQEVPIAAKFQANPCVTE